MHTNSFDCDGHLCSGTLVLHKIGVLSVFVLPNAAT